MSVKLYTHDEYLAAKRLGGPSLLSTSEGSTLLNVMKHYCRQKPYKNPEFQNIMLKEIKAMKKATKDTTAVESF